MHFYRFVNKWMEKFSFHCQKWWWRIVHKPALGSCGKNSCVLKDRLITNPQNVFIGDNFMSMQRLRLEAVTRFKDQKFNPKIVIGNNVTFNTDVHIGAIDSVAIGDNVLLASRIFISDHSHGAIDKDTIQLPPNDRLLISKGAVIIEQNVWIGEGVCIMPGVTIGQNSIIGANSVVTKSIPPNAVAAGIPASVLKQF